MARLWPAVVAAVLLAMLFAIWPGLDQPGRTPREALLLVAAPLLLGLAAASPRRRVPATLWLPLTLAAAAGILGVIRAPAGETSSVMRDLLLLGAGWLLALAAAMRPGESAADGSDRGVHVVAGVGLALLGAIGLAQAWFGWNGLPQAAPPAGGFVNRNVAAQVLVALIPLSAAGLVAGTTPRSRWGAGLATGLGLAFLVATRSRGAWLGLVAGAAVALVAMALARRAGAPPPPWRRIAGPGLLVAASLVVALLVPIGTDAKGSVGETLRSLSEPSAGTGAIRLAFWRNSLEMVRDEPLSGVGAGRFAVVYPLYHHARRPTPGFGTWLQVEHPHSDLLEFATEGGLLSALALLFLLAGAVYRSVGAVVRGRTLAERTAATARAAALSGVLVHGLLSFPLHSPASSFLAWLLIGRAWASDDARPATSSSRPLILGLAAVVMLAGFWLGARELRGRRALTEALRAHAVGACDSAIAAAERTRRLVPWRRRDCGMAAMVRFECERDALRSLEALEPALALQPNNLNLLLATGSRRLKNGNPSGGEQAFSHAVRISPALGRGWLGLAMCLDSQGRRAETAAACRKAVELLPQMREARLFCEGNGYLSP